MLSVCYVAFQRLLQLVGLVFRSKEFKELEIVVLRHELALLRRQADRFFCAAASRLFIEIGSRRVHLAGCTAHPDGEWVTQQARQVAWTVAERKGSVRFLIRDHDRKFTAVLSPQTFWIFAREFSSFRRQGPRTGSDSDLDTGLLVSRSMCGPGFRTRLPTQGPVGPVVRRAVSMRSSGGCVD